MSNRLNAEIQRKSRDLSASGESLSRLEGAMVEAKRVFEKKQRETWETLCKTREALAETKEDCQEKVTSMKKELENTKLILLSSNYLP